jgi:hypothetical protein
VTPKRLQVRVSRSKHVTLKAIDLVRPVWLPRLDYQAELHQTEQAHHGCLCSVAFTKCGKPPPCKEEGEE